MINLIKNIFTWVNKTVVVEIFSDNVPLDWNRLSKELTGNFSFELSLRKPVGKVNANGFQFTLNYINFYPVLPKVVVKQDRNSIVITQSYSKKTRWLQIHNLTVLTAFLSVPIYFIVEFFLNDSVLAFLDYFGRILALSITFALWTTFLWARKKMWEETIEKTKELLGLVRGESV